MFRIIIKNLKSEVVNTGVSDTWYGIYNYTEDFFEHNPDKNPHEYEVLIRKIKYSV